MDLHEKNVNKSGKEPAPEALDPDAWQAPEDEALPGQLELPLHPLRRVLRLGGLAALLLVLIFLLVKLIGLPGDGADLRLPAGTEASVPVTEEPAPEPAGTETTEPAPSERSAAADLTGVLLAPLTRAPRTGPRSRV